MSLKVESINYKQLYNNNKTQSEQQFKQPYNLYQKNKINNEWKKLTDEEKTEIYRNKKRLIGKYKGETIGEILKKDKNYLLYIWGLENINTGLKYIINYLLEKDN